MRPSFRGAAVATSPFPHAAIPAVLSPADAATVLSWMRTEAPWTLRVENFYEQYEFSLLGIELPFRVRGLTHPDFIQALRSYLQESIGAPEQLELVDVSAHKLVPGQTIRVHNDFIGNEETHRVLVQLNEGWSLDKGGLLMLFDSDRPEDVTAAIMPTHASGFAFEISPRSFHAVSTIKSGERFTLVYTFRTS